MDARTISRIRTAVYVILLVGIALAIVYREEIGAWLISELASGTDSQLQQLLR